MAGMNKADRAEFEARKDRLGHYQRIALEQCIAYGLESKSAWLAAQREKEAAALAELNEGEKAYAAECLANGATIEDSIEAAKEAAKRLAETDNEEVKMEKIEFNTGRKYAVNGQPVVAVRFGDSVIFKDEARFIVGTFELPAGQLLTQQAVMKAYDNYNYRMATWRKEYDANSLELGSH